MKPEEDKESGGIPLKASRPGGASIRMTRSQPDEPSQKPTPEPMSDEEKKSEPAAESAGGEEKPKVKLPPKKAASGLPKIGEMKAQEPPAAPAGSPGKEEDAAPDSGDVASEISSGAPEGVDEAPAEDQKEGKKEEQKAAAKPKLTPKLPPKPSSGGAATPPPVSAPKPPAPAAPAPKAESAPKKTPPPKPHVVRPGAATAKSQPTQGGSAVPVMPQKKASSGVSAVALALDVLACIGALAVGFLVLNDLLKIL